MCAVVIIHKCILWLPFSSMSFKQMRNGSRNEEDGGFCIEHHNPVSKKIVFSLSIKSAWSASIKFN